jgi:hypothetical protein
VRASIHLFALALAWFFQPAPTATPAFRAFSYQSQILGGSRTYRVLLPAAYESRASAIP